MLVSSRVVVSKSHKKRVRAEQRKKRKADGPLYLETAVSTLRETSHLTSAPSSDCPTKIAASNTTVFLKNEPVKK